MDDAMLHIEKMDIHRDNYYIFFVLTQGTVLMKCDMLDVELWATSIGMIKPLQIHSIAHVSADAAGYFISVVPFLIPNDCVYIFQNGTTAQQFKKLECAEKTDFLDHVSLLYRTFKNRNLSKTKIINSLFNALVYRLVNFYELPVKPAFELKNQSKLITAHFRKLLAENRVLESPSFYANSLNISTSHLNDCVKNCTGQSVTYWLQNAMVLEAQRQLYYTEADVKEIAFCLGFTDHTYFSRLFKKITAETPLAFRKKFRG